MTKNVEEINNRFRKTEIYLILKLKITPTSRDWALSDEGGWSELISIIDPIDKFWVITTENNVYKT